MAIYIRTDASDTIGSGHVMRCLALADELKAREAKVKFICARSPGNLIDEITRAGYEVINFSYAEEIETTKRWKVDSIKTMEIIKKDKAGIDLLIVDHYGLDCKWEEAIAGLAEKIMVIDDLADRVHNCDFLLDQNLYHDPESRYANLLPPKCSMMLGPEFALLRREFKNARKSATIRNGAIRRILITFGNNDAANETLKALRGIALLKRDDFVLDIVIGSQNSHRGEIEDFASCLSGATCYYKTDSISQLMLAADLCLGAGGITTWERCCLGVPSLVISIADNQTDAIRYLADNKFLHYLGQSQEVTTEHIKDTLGSLCEQPEILQRYSQVCFDLVDGYGAERCAEVILNGYNYGRQEKI